MKDTTGIVLLHGAGLGSYIWDEMIPHLDIASIAVDFPNRNGGNKANAGLNLNDYTNAVLDRIENWNKENIILVTHSISGVVGLSVAKKLEHRLAGFVAIGASIPKNGGSFLSSLPLPQHLIMWSAITLAGTKPPVSAIRLGLCNDLTKEQADKVVENFTPESKRLYTQKSHAGIPSVKTMYIKLSLDNEFPLGVQNQFARNLNTSQIVELESGHLPMLSVPGLLAATINNFVEEVVWDGL